MTEYFYDSYAIVEFLNQNPKYRRYFLEERGVTSFYNLLEVFYTVLRAAGIEPARKVLVRLQPLLVDVSLADAEPAMAFRLKHTKLKLSYADCLGYTIARRKGLIFLTGDKAFEDIPNVRFIR